MQVHKFAALPLRFVAVARRRPGPTAAAGEKKS
jgi:hypothetical protein